MTRKAMQPDGKMDPQHVEFCHRYVQHWNKSRAAREAEYSEGNAGTQAGKLLKRPDVIDYIATLQRAKLAAVDLDTDDILAGLGRIATYDIGRLIDSHGNPMAVHDIPEELRRCLESIKFQKVTTVVERRRLDGDEPTEETVTVTTQVVEVKMPGRLRAYELYGQHLQLFSPDAVVREPATLIIDGRKLE